MMQPSTLTEISSSTSVPQQSSMKLYGPGLYINSAGPVLRVNNQYAKFKYTEMKFV